MSITGHALGTGDGDAAQHDATVFLSYRRDDTGQSVELIHARLTEAFGKDSVYLDTAAEPGAEWQEDLKRRGSRATLLLVLIGPDWFDEMRRRAGKIDWVRREVEWALSDWPGHLVPLLIGTDIGDDEIERLPRSIKPLFRLDYRKLRIGHIASDLEAFIEELEKLVKAPALRSFHDVTSRPALPRELAIDSEAGVGPPLERHYQEVLRDMLRGRVVPVLGPGARGRPPESDQLAEGLAQQYKELAAGCTDLPELAQRVWAVDDDSGLTSAISELIDPEPKPTDVHWFLARFPRIMRELGREPAHQMIITTSYDRALEAAFDRLYEPYDLVVYLPDLVRYVLFPWAADAAAASAEPIVDPNGEALGIDVKRRLDRPMIVKLHGAPGGHEGSLKWSDSYVVTEDHYIDYPPGNLPNRIVEKLLEDRCLFLGYRLRDWNARVLLRRAWPPGLTRRGKFWAIEESPDLLEATAWERVPNSVLLAEGPCAFMRRLETMLERWPGEADALATTG